MNQVEKTEIILGLISVAKSKLMSLFFTEGNKEISNHKKITKIEKDIEGLDIILGQFYKKLHISDKEYNELVSDIRKYDNFAIPKEYQREISLEFTSSSIGRGLK